MSRPAGKGDQQLCSLVFTHRQGQTVQVAATHLLQTGRCSICSRAAFRPVPTQARGEGGCSPSPNTALLQQHSYLKFKGCSEQIKGEKNADTICLGEANCKQFCYSTAFYLSIDTDPAAGAQRRHRLHMDTLRQNLSGPHYFAA